ncbi:MAG: insulinase family protein, partial [Burkholderiales bacterium]|nr:insulinase family protein [Anaerolineae bacterium]
MKRSVLLLCLLTLFSLSGYVITQAQDDETSLDVIEYTLANGLEVILVEDHSAPTVAVDIWYRVGGANDPAGRSGFAHLFEHMMFQGSAHIGKGELDSLIEAVGGNIPNAYTDAEQTAYFQIVPSQQLPLALWVEADRMASLAVNQTNFDNQRAVVIEEYQLRVGNAPYGEAFEEIFTAPLDYAPYRQRVIGSIEDLNAATLDDVREFHATYYVPNNATLVVAGDFDAEQTRTLIDEYFGDIPAQAEPPELPAYEPTERGGAERVTLEDPLIADPALLIGYAGPPRADDDYPALELATRILGAGNSSRMAQAFLDTGLAADASILADGNTGPSIVIGYVFPNSGVALEEVEQVYNGEIERIMTEGVDADELEKAINQISSERLVGLETAADLAEAVQDANHFFDDPQAVFGELEEFRAVTSEDIQRVVGEYLAPEDQYIMTVVPGEPTTADDPEPVVGGTGSPEDDEVEPTFTIEQETPPDALPINEFVLPQITEATLDNGLDVIVVERAELPIISLDLFLLGGRSAESAEQAGVSALAANLLTRGTETRSAQDIASAIEQVGGIIGAEAREDGLSMGVFALKEDQDLAFDLLGDIALHSTFPEGELDIQRDIMLTDLAYSLTVPDEIATRTFLDLVFGDNPYGGVPTEDSLAALEREDIVDYYNQHLNPERAFLIIAGDVTVDEALAMAEATFGDWEAPGDAAEIAVPATPVSAEPAIYLVDRPGSTQATFLLGELGISGDSPDRYEIQVMNQILGGSFGSRLVRQLREELGYTYSISSGFNTPAEQGYFRVRASVRNDVAGPALQAILDEIEAIRSEPVSTDELADVQANIVGRFALRLETYQDFVDEIAALKLAGLP